MPISINNTSVLMYLSLDSIQHNDRCCLNVPCELHAVIVPSLIFHRCHFKKSIQAIYCTHNLHKPSSQCLPIVSFEH